MYNNVNSPEKQTSCSFSLEIKLYVKTGPAANLQNVTVFEKQVVFR